MALSLRGGFVNRWQRVGWLVEEAQKAGWKLTLTFDGTRETAYVIRPHDDARGYGDFEGDQGSILESLEQALAEAAR